MSGRFKHYELELFTPDFKSELTDIILDLEYLKKTTPQGTTSPFLFEQVKEILQQLENLASARIEGNNTTIADLVDDAINPSDSPGYSLLEVKNLEEAMAEIDRGFKDLIISEKFIRELHSIVVKGLPVDNNNEGDRTPGSYRNYEVSILGSNHKPPILLQDIEYYLSQLVEFINRDDPPKYDLIKVALVHHRFMWIHPFGNGNGRTGRLLTYAMLLRYGFNFNQGKLISPNAIFCLDRYAYYHKLSAADAGNPEGIEEWCLYVLKGLKSEIKKINKLLDNEYFKAEIVLPSIGAALQAKVISKDSAEILIAAIEHPQQHITNGDIKAEYLKKKTTYQISMLIKALTDDKLLKPLPDSPRKYYLNFSNNFLLRYIVATLKQKGFIAFD